MAFVIGDRVLETTTTTGTGTITLAGAITGYRTFATIATTNGDTFYYQISGGSEWEVGLGTRASATTLTRTTVFASSNAGALVNFSAGVKEVWMDATAEQLRWTINKTTHPNVQNGMLAATVNANAATFALRTLANAVPSANDPVLITFVNSATGVSTVIRVTAALTFIVANGATMGGLNNTPLRIWCGVLLNGTTPELFVRNCTIAFNSVVGFPVGQITTTTSAGGGDDSAQVTYSTTGRSAVPFIILGYADWDITTLAIAGAYATNPNKIVFGAPATLPGMSRNFSINNTAVAATGTTAAFVDVVSLTYAMASRCNSCEVSGLGGSVLTGVSGVIARLRLINSITSFVMATFDMQQNSGTNWNLSGACALYGIDLPASDSVTYKIQISNPGAAGSAVHPAGGSAATITVREIMG